MCDALASDRPCFRRMAAPGAPSYHIFGLPRYSANNVCFVYYWEGFCLYVGVFSILMVVFLPCYGAQISFPGKLVLCGCCKNGSLKIMACDQVFDVSTVQSLPTKHLLCEWLRSCIVWNCLCVHSLPLSCLLRLTYKFNMFRHPQCLSSAAHRRPR